LVDVMARRTVSRWKTLAALAAALAACAPGALAAGPGGVPGAPGLPSVPGVGVPGGGGPGPGGGGSTPGGPIGGGLSGGVGGPSGGLGSSRGQGGGRGGAAISPLSPNASPLGGGGPATPPGLARGRAPDAPGKALGQVNRRGGDLVEAAKAKGRDTKADAADLTRAAAKTGDESDEAIADLTEVRRNQARALLAAHGDVVEPDDLGQPVVRGEILALAPSPAALAQAQRAGFRIRAREALPGLGVQSVVLTSPRGVSAVEALRRLRALDPAGRYDFNHLYQESGFVTALGPAAPPPVKLAAAEAPARGVRIGLVDGGVAAGQPALSGARVVQKAFAAGGLAPSPHATAVASLLAGRQGPFRGAAPGATVLVADVYGHTPTGGSAEAIVRALAWLAEAGAPVINISLVGPPNILLEAAVKALIARGHVVVAAVGNDGPAAPPLYPAAYPGVVAVTGVDARRRLLPEASRGTHVDFAAPGSEMAAAGVDGGFVAVRGTSFAAPLAAGLLARQMPAADRGAAGRALAAVGRQAMDLGPRGPDPQFGRGLVGFDLRTAPPDVGARLALRGP
jgi:hypothetical protein